MPETHITDFDELGGYLELELPRRANPFQSHAGFNTARNGLILLLKGITRRNPKGPLYLPRFLCPDVGEALRRELPDLKVNLYSINSSLLPDENILNSEGIIYFYNIFGLMNHATKLLPKATIVDNVHAFYAPHPGKEKRALYSARKFFGVPDGAFVTAPDELPNLPPRRVGKLATHLFKRIEFGAKAAYADFQLAEQALSKAAPEGMSVLSRRILNSIDYDAVASRRIDNFLHIHNRFKGINELTNKISSALKDDNYVPFSYPLMLQYGEGLRKHLNAAGILNPLLWDGISVNNGATSFEERLAKDVIHVPIDQRYGMIEMDHISQNLMQALKKDR